ncbi:nicotianamine synthase family protein [Brevibacillus dissolubilis]|uniref:nicotianamine synthase family protein n=1 Tax=Brevibacillus dissolubilis TaxID=1844116 RepID=UPI00111636F7|nr:nicotianamine synthase family protein [Brevibacillus dissolubilis]
MSNQTIQTEQKERLLHAVIHAHHTLHQETDLSPRNPKINHALSDLVAQVSLVYSSQEEQDILTDERIRQLRSTLLPKLSIAEAEMEFYYAQEYSENLLLNMEHLRDFLYWDNYEALVQVELEGLAACRPQVEGYPVKVSPLEVAQGEAVAFVGAGPFPLSAIILHQQTGVPVVCIDVDAAAVGAGRALIERLGLQEQITYLHRSGEQVDYAPYPLIFCASLIPDKQQVVEQIQRTRGKRADASRPTILAVRSADGVHTLLYEPVDEREMDSLGARLIGRTWADTRIINSTLYYLL